ncbi:SEC-C domain-containing protein [bacterium]|nr:SEC-C domain-containing protein [candidate division CSSED10-310 bacterium]
MNFWSFLFPKKPPKQAVRLNRNDPCWCGSGKKYKKCHHESDQNYFMKMGGKIKLPG